MQALFIDLTTYRQYLKRGLLAAFAVSASALLFVICTMLTDEALLALFALLVLVGVSHNAGKYLFPDRREWWIVYVVSPFALMWAGIFGVVFATFKPPIMVILLFAVTLQTAGVFATGVAYTGYRLYMKYLNRIEAHAQRRQSLSEA